MDTFKKTVGLTDEEDDDKKGILSSFGDDFKRVTKMSWTNRLIGFGICSGLAALFIVLGCILAFFNKAVFAVLFTSGMILAVAGTFFLADPIKQVKNIVQPQRIIAVIALTLAFVLTFCAVFWWDLAGLAFLFAAIQVICFIWYCITYIPYAQTCITKSCATLFTGCC
ncbi:vesicle transport protein SFT2B-like [Dysidea avara]|uniref:vesicle transport protein SFT2B-like n=1 Tax=Dysidea avara TaxID=196820 RepID=UPI00331B98E8